MSEMVERVALAVAQANIAGPDFDPFESPDTFAFCERIARTAITAMREATDEMQQAVFTRSNEVLRPGCEFSPKTTWEIMVDAVLKSKEGLPHAE